MSKENQKWIRVFIITFMVILYIPATLGGVSLITGLKCDFSLNGYTDEIEKPELSVDGFWNGTYQEKFAEWYNHNIKPYGFFTKTYATIRYNLFNLGTETLGKNHDIYELDYIKAELVLDQNRDMRINENAARMEEYVEKLVLLQNKLNSCGKTLYVCITPNKADYNRKNLPLKYVLSSDGNAIKPVDYFAELIDQTEVPHLICRDMMAELVYPPFYTTGIHWSRTYSQTATARIIDELATLNQKKYPHAPLEEAKTSKKPYWWDSDVYDLLNVWNLKKNETYYEYSVDSLEYLVGCDKINVLFQGTSFSQCIQRDIYSLYPKDSNFYYINRNQFFQVGMGEIVELESFEQLDIFDWLNHVDSVVIETTESELTRYSQGFVDYLLDSLDNYVPIEDTCQYISCADMNDSSIWNSDSFCGLYSDNGFAWGEKYCRVILDCDGIEDNGIRIDCTVPDKVFYENTIEDQVKVFINGKEVYREAYGGEWIGAITVPIEQIDKQDDKYIVEIVCSKDFNPSKLGMSVDNRDLAIQLRYVGENR